MTARIRTKDPYDERAEALSALEVFDRRQLDEARRRAAWEEAMLQKLGATDVCGVIAEMKEIPRTEAAALLLKAVGLTPAEIDRGYRERGDNRRELLVARVRALRPSALARAQAAVCKELDHVQASLSRTYMPGVRAEQGTRATHDRRLVQLEGAKRALLALETVADVEPGLAAIVAENNLLFLEKQS